ncbi:MAG: hypothetical protein ACI9MJ_001002 [Alphaproteobacteria bacterium]|jgi:hypothetical protein
MRYAILAKVSDCLVVRRQTTGQRGPRQHFPAVAHYYAVGKPGGGTTRLCRGMAVFEKMGASCAVTWLPLLRSNFNGILSCKPS